MVLPFGKRLAITLRASTVIETRIILRPAAQAGVIEASAAPHLLQTAFAAWDEPISELQADRCFQRGARRTQGNSPGLVADNPVLRDAAPGLKRHNEAFVCGPKLPSIPCGFMFHCPGAPLVSNVCKLSTTDPVEPSCSVGIGPPSGRAAQVTGPTIPSTVSPAPCWNCLTAVSTCGPKTPSTVSPGLGVRRSARSNRFTASPVAPRLIVGCPGLAMRSLSSRGRGLTCPC